MKNLQIAFRNILRNKRRSIMTILAISIGALSILTFGGFFFATMFGMETVYVRMLGHVQVYKTGFFEFGASNPADYSIENYAAIKKAIENDDLLKDKFNVVTPILQISGIVGNFKDDVSKTFFGVGVIPSDQKTMGEWKGRHIHFMSSEATGLDDQDIEGGVIGFGMARILNLCDEMDLMDCKDRKKIDLKTIDAPEENFDSIVALDTDNSNRSADSDSRPRLDLLASQAGGAPNVVSISVNKAQRLMMKELDENYVVVNLKLAQRLVYGNDKPEVSGVIIQLKSQNEMASAIDRLGVLFDKHGFDLEIKRFDELAPYYGQVQQFIGSFFMFTAIIMGVVVLFTVINTMSMCVMERVQEIGTIRALGVRRSAVVKQFIIEGGLLGIIGGTLGLILALLLQYVIISSNISYIPPGNVEPVPLVVQIFGRKGFAPGIWVMFIMICIASSYIPARKAGKMRVVDALGHS